MYIEYSELSRQEQKAVAVVILNDGGLLFFLGWRAYTGILGRNLHCQWHGLCVPKKEQLSLWEEEKSSPLFHACPSFRILPSRGHASLAFKGIHMPQPHNLTPTEALSVTQQQFKQATVAAANGGISSTTPPPTHTHTHTHTRTHTHVIFIPALMKAWDTARELGLGATQIHIFRLYLYPSHFALALEGNSTYY